MPRSLYARSVLILLVLLIFVGTIGFFVALHASRRHEQEVTQRLNRGLAANLVGENVLLVDGEVNEAALEQVFHTLTIINPSIEVYLLDLEGRVVQTATPSGQVVLDRVDVGPIKAMLAGDRQLPILGDDPREPDRRRVFSVSPIMVEDRYEGYLYVVLASQRHDSVVAQLQASHMLRLSVGALGAALLVALLAGTALLALVTRPLRAVSAAVDHFRATDFAEPLAVRWPGGSAGDDEIGRLGGTVERMANRILELVGRLRRTDSMRRELVANVSHDLKTPLASLRGYLETLVLKDGDLAAAERHEYLEVAVRQSEHLGTLVEELFELARLESTEMHPDLEPFAIAELVQDVVQEFRLEASRRGVDLVLDLPADAPLVNADIGLMQRVLQNLLGNALKHTETDGVVKVAVETRDNAVTVRVQDTGCGIPENELERVFDRFYQAATPEAPRPRTGGLGLAIVKRILDLHGTGVQAASSVGEGTEIRFSLPVAAV